VLAIPEHFSGEDIRRIVLAVDLSGLLPQQWLQFLKTFAETCNASIDIIHVRDRNEISLPGEAKAVQQLRDTFGTECTIVPVAAGETISIVINRYLADHQADLLVTVPHAHTWLDRLLIGSETRELASLIHSCRL
jgi:nucleotide-binding universal stress UspA family protein